jgi:hypothetical protein
MRETRVNGRGETDLNGGYAIPVPADISGPAAIGEAFDQGDSIIVAMPGVGMGWPTLPDDHNCDAMGCGAWHVLYRFKKPNAPHQPRERSAATGTSAACDGWRAP